ncbi:hypothetical protein KP509_10G078800 [Ceratopteris richardii]|uniref:Uncharacterized protein n=1 Tax=Ceratopteris richardii TaxID=49495 RepID=A0A8T2TWR8_CERRI|nr:hypothetical protein KP509_10G078800 [Ceratopteris richardii]
MAAIVGVEFCTPEPVKLTVSKKVMCLSGRSFEVTDGEGYMRFKMEGSAFSPRDKRVLLDVDCNPIVSARKKIGSMHDRWKVYRGDRYKKEAELFSVKRASLFQLKTHLKILLSGNCKEDCPDFVIKGDFFGHEAKIYRGDEVIAEIKRKFTVGNVLLDKRTFSTFICAGVDQAFIVTLVVIMDAIHERE